MSEGIWVELVGGQVQSVFAVAQPDNPNVVFWESTSPEFRAYRLAQRKAARLQELAAVGNSKVQAGLSFTHNGQQRTTVLSTERLQVIMGIYALVVGTVLTQAGLMKQQGLPDVNYPPGDIPFETKDGTIINLTRSEAVALAQQALGRMVLLTSRRNVLISEINAAGTLAALNGIDLSAGWPS